VIFTTLLFFLVFAVPLFFSSWRAMFASLGIQAIILSMVMAHEANEPSGAVAVFDLALVRGILAPAYLVWMVESAPGKDRLDVIPGNLLHWTIALALVVASGTFAAVVAPQDISRAFHVATAASETVIALFILATQTQPLGQAIGALTLENGVIVLEVLGQHRLELPVQIGVATIFVGLVLLFGWFLRELRLSDSLPPPEPPPADTRAPGQTGRWSRL
jgi:hydrogenase-4 membrane subunit HyfE